MAERIVAELGAPEHVARIEIAGPGFINFFLTHAWLANLVAGVEVAGEAWGRSEAPEPQRIQVEFVSANPTGPVHVGNARWASVGDAIAALLDATGHEVEREYYVNDHGRQVELFGLSAAASTPDAVRLGRANGLRRTACIACGAATAIRGRAAMPGRPSVSRVPEGAADNAATQLVRVQPHQLSVSDARRRHIPERVTGRVLRGVKGLAARRRSQAPRSEQPGGRASVGTRR